jgi:hypothetical protein
MDCKKYTVEMRNSQGDITTITVEALSHQGACHAATAKRPDLTVLSTVLTDTVNKVARKTT